MCYPHLTSNGGVRVITALLCIGVLRYRDGAGNTVEENSIVFSLIRMC